MRASGLAQRLLWVAIFSLAATAWADERLGYGLEIDVNSQYVWRGIVFEDHPVIQPTVWLAAQDLTLSVWNNCVTQSEQGILNGNEYDFALAYEKEFAGVSAEGGFAYYVYPHQEDAPPTGEISAKLSVPVGVLKLSTVQSLDVVEYPGAYYGELGIGWEHALTEKWETNISAAGGWASAEFNETYAGVRQPAMNLLSGQAAVTYAVTEFLYLKPHVEWFHVLDAAVAGVTQRDAINLGGTVGLEW